MFVTESRSHLGFLPLQHENFEQQVGRRILDQRAGVFGVRILEHLTDAGEQGKFLIDENSVGDVIGSFLWPNFTRRIPAWRMGAWPVLTVDRGSAIPTTSAGFGQAGTPPLFRDRGTGGLNDSEVFLPILNDRFDRDSRFRARQFRKPKIGARVARDPGAATSIQVDVEVDAWPKFPLGWHGIAIAADEETSQNDLFMPADPRLVLVNSENADPEAGTLLVELNRDNEVDAKRMSRLHAAFRVFSGPAIFCGEPTTARFGDKLDVGVLAWNTFTSGGSDQLPSGLLVGPGDGNDNVLAALTSARGGPIDLGVDRDRHRIGNVGRFPINQAHIWGGAVYRFGPSGVFDAPLLHHGRADIGFDSLPKDIERLAIESGGVVPVFFVYDGTMRHEAFCGQSAPGVQRWFAVIPDEESARPDELGKQTFDPGPFPPPPPPPPELGKQTFDPGPFRPPPPLQPPELGKQVLDDPPEQPPPPEPPDGPPRRSPAPMPPDDDDVDFIPPDLPCPAEDDPVDFDPGGEETGGTPLDGPCTSGPIHRPKPPTPEESRAEEIRNAMFGPRNAPIFGLDATGANPLSGPAYARNSLSITQMAALFSEGHQLYPEDRTALSDARIARQIAFSGAPHGDLKRETFIETVRARGLTNLFFRASWLGDEAPNFPQWTGRAPGGGSSAPSGKARRIRQELQPVVARYEAWGNQNDTLLGFDYTDNPHASRYLNVGTSQGGVALLPPETSLDDLRRGVETVGSQIYFDLADNVDLAIGAVPSLSDGSVRGGWILHERQSTDDLSFMRGKNSAPVDTDSVIRFDQSDNVHLDFGQGDADAAAGLGVLGMRNAGTNPTGTPANGVVLFASGGEIFVRDGSGSTINLATGAGATPGNTVTVTADYNVQTVDDVILVDASGTAGDITITLPANTTAADLDGARFTVKKIDSSDSDVIVVGTNPITAGGDLIDGAVSLTISDEDDAYEFTSDGEAWRITSEPGGVGGGSVRTFVATTASAATTLTVADDVLLVDASVAETTVTLPSAAGNAGQRFTVKKIDSSNSANMILAASGGDLIDGQADVRSTFENTVFEVVSDGGTDWRLAQLPFDRGSLMLRSTLFDTTLLITDNAIHASAAISPITISLPAAATLAGRIFRVKKIDPSADAVTIMPITSQTIENQSSISITGFNQTVVFYATFSTWHLLGDLSQVLRARTFTATTADLTDSVAEVDHLLLVDAAAGASTITLPEAQDVTGRRFTVKKIDSTPNVITIDAASQTTAGNNLLDGAFSQTLVFEDDAYEFFSDGTAWFIVSKPPLRGARTFTGTTADATDTMTSADDVLLVDSSVQGVTITLPDVAVMSGRRVTVKKFDPSTNAVVVNTPGAELIDGFSSLLIEDQYDAFEFASDGSNWHVTSEPSPTKTCVVVTGDTTVDTGTHDRVLVDASGGLVTVTLPAAVADLHGTRFLVKKIDSSVNAVTITALQQLTSGANLLEGEFTQVLTQEDAFLEFTHDGTAWFITGSNEFPQGGGLGFGPIADETINTAGSASVSSHHLRLSGTTADTLTDLITTGILRDGDVIMIRPANGQTIVVETGTGNIRLDNDVDLNLQAVNHNIVLGFDATAGIGGAGLFFQISKGLGQA